MPHFFLKLIPPRSDFAVTMTPEERVHMGEHLAYVLPFFEQGKLLAYGPVMSADEGSYGMGILDMADTAEAEAFAQNDPTVRSGMDRFTISPMILGGAQAQHNAEARN